MLGFRVPETMPINKHNHIRDSERGGEREKARIENDWLDGIFPLGTIFIPAMWMVVLDEPAILKTDCMRCLEPSIRG
jgi:hypothetical protein